MSKSSKNCYDIIINGGGIVGFTLLNLLLKSPLLSRAKILLIEQVVKPKNQNLSQHLSTSPVGDTIERTFSNRVSSITGASRSCLSHLGAWKKVESFSKEVKAIEVWNYDYSHKIVFDRSESFGSNSSSETMFSVVENNRLLAAILSNIHEHSITDDLIAWNHTLESLGESSEDGLVDVLVRSNENDEEVRISASLVLGCDGFNSKVRALSGIKYREIDLKKKAVVGTVHMDTTVDGSSNNETAFQKFSADKDTVVALLPLDGEHSSFVISAPNDYSDHLANCDSQTFETEINKLLASREAPPNILLKGIHNITNVACEGIHRFCSMMPFKNSSSELNQNFSDSYFEGPPIVKSVIEGSRASFPLFFGTTTPKMTASLPSKKHCQIAILGDSSHRVHPLAGQGLNLGIQDAYELVKQLELAAGFGDKLFTSRDHFSLDRVLKKYECNRQTYIAPMSAAILGMPSLFKLTPSRIVSAFNMCDPLKLTTIKVADGSLCGK